MKKRSPYATHETPLREAEQYVRVLDTGVKIGLGILLITFFVYAAGFLPGNIPLADLPRYRHLPLKEFVHAQGGHTGWSWLSLLRYGDFFSYTGIAFLAGITTIAYLRIVPVLFRKKERIFLLIVVIEIAVLLLAASGVLHAGH